MNKSLHKNNCMQYIFSLAIISVILSGCTHLGDNDSFSGPLYADNYTDGLTCVRGEDGSFSYYVNAESNPMHTYYVKNEHWSGLLHDNVGNKGRSGSGFNPLTHEAYPWQRLFHPGYVGLNFEHIFNGVKADNKRAMFTPRKDTVNLITFSLDAKNNSSTYASMSC